MSFRGAPSMKRLNHKRKKKKARQGGKIKVTVQLAAVPHQSRRTAGTKSGRLQRAKGARVVPPPAPEKRERRSAHIFPAVPGGESGRN